MFARLAWRNVRASARDYTLYFVNLAFAVALFYAFNSFGDIVGFLEVHNIDETKAVASSSDFLFSVSLAVAGAFALLLAHANRTLVASRRREFAIYAALGIPRWRISCILVLEMAAVGVLSLAVGLPTGAGLAQVLVHSTAALLGVEVTGGGLVLSAFAAKYTAACFFAVFLAALIVQVVILGRIAPSELLRPGAQHEAVSQHPLAVAGRIVAFLGLTALAWMLSHADTEIWGPEGFEPGRTTTPLILVLFAASLLFFRAAPGLAGSFLRRSDSLYLRSIRPFEVRQFAFDTSRSLSLGVDTMTIVAAAVIVASASVAVSVLRIPLATAEHFDATISAFPQAFHANIADASAIAAQREAEDEALDDKSRDFGAKAVALDAELTECGNSLTKLLARRLPAWKTRIADSLEIDLYAPADLQVSPARPKDASARADATSTESTLLSLSQYNAMAAATNGDMISLADDAFAIDHTSTLSMSHMASLKEGDLRMSAGGQSLTYSGKLVTTELRVHAGMPDETRVLIVPDPTLQALRAAGLAPQVSYVNVIYRSADKLESDANLDTDLAASLTDFYAPSAIATDYKASPFLTAVPALWMEMSSSALGETHRSILLLVFGAAYLGLALLVIGAIILAIGHVENVAQSEGCYRALASMGTDESVLRGSIRRLTLAWFAGPTLLAGAFLLVFLQPFLGRIAEPFQAAPASRLAVAIAIASAVYALCAFVAWSSATRMLKRQIRAQGR